MPRAGLSSSDLGPRPQPDDSFITLIASSGFTLCAGRREELAPAFAPTQHAPRATRARFYIFVRGIADATTWSKSQHPAVDSPHDEIVSLVRGRPPSGAVVRSRARRLGRRRRRDAISNPSFLILAAAVCGRRCCSGPAYSTCPAQRFLGRRSPRRHAAGWGPRPLRAPVRHLDAREDST